MYDVWYKTISQFSDTQPSTIPTHQRAKEPKSQRAKLYLQAFEHAFYSLLKLFEHPSLIHRLFRWHHLRRLLRRLFRRLLHPLLPGSPGRPLLSRRFWRGGCGSVGDGSLSLRLLRRWVEGALFLSVVDGDGDAGRGCLSRA